MLPVIQPVIETTTLCMSRDGCRPAIPMWNAKNREVPNYNNIPGARLLTISYL